MNHLCLQPAARGFSGHYHRLRRRPEPTPV